ncbi:MAG TPA: hypothetical protein VIS48_09755 [Candidatus Kryptonia bacterium]
MPIVSNIGDVAITVGTKVSFFSERGNLKGIWNSRTGFLGDSFEMLEAYSSSGKYYYTTIGSDMDSLCLLTLSDSGVELHREPLNALHPCERDGFQAYKDKLIVFDCGAYNDPDYVNNCCVFNERGELIWEYDEQLIDRSRERRWHVMFDPLNGLLTIINGVNRKTFIVDTLQ